MAEGGWGTADRPHTRGKLHTRARASCSFRCQIQDASSTSGFGAQPLHAFERSLESNQKMLLVL